MSKRMASCPSAQVTVSDRVSGCVHVPPGMCVLGGGTPWLKNCRSWDLSKDMARFPRVARAGVPS